MNYYQEAMKIFFKHASDETLMDLLKVILQNNPAAIVRAEKVLTKRVDSSLREKFQLSEKIFQEAVDIVTGLPDKKIEAIKRVRALTGLGLREAKYFVEEVNQLGETL